MGPLPLIYPVAAHQSSRHGLYDEVYGVFSLKVKTPLTVLIFGPP